VSLDKKVSIKFRIQLLIDHVREPAVLSVSTRLDGDLQELRLRSVMDAISVLLIAMS